MIPLRIEPIQAHLMQNRGICPCCIQLSLTPAIPRFESSPLAERMHPSPRLPPYLGPQDTLRSGVPSRHVAAPKSQRLGQKWTLSNLCLVGLSPVCNPLLHRVYCRHRRMQSPQSIADHERNSLRFGLAPLECVLALEHSANFELVQPQPTNSFENAPVRLIPTATPRKTNEHYLRS